MALALNNPCWLIYHQNKEMKPNWDTPHPSRWKELLASSFVAGHLCIYLTSLFINYSFSLFIIVKPSNSNLHLYLMISPSGYYATDSQLNERWESLLIYKNLICPIFATSVIKLSDYSDPSFMCNGEGASVRLESPGQFFFSLSHSHNLLIMDKMWYKVHF